MAWVFLVLLYGLLKGGRELVKKKALTVSTVMEVLVVYTALSFVMVVPDIPQADVALVGRFHLRRIKTDPVVPDQDFMETVPLSCNDFNDSLIPDPDAVADGVFHHGLQRQGRQ